jgi:hypothetical protein
MLGYLLLDLTRKGTQSLIVIVLNYYTKDDEGLIEFYITHFPHPLYKDVNLPATQTSDPKSK